MNLIAHKLGRLRKGGVPDREAAARCVLRDLYTGKLPFYTLPPSEAVADEEKSELAIATSWGKELDLDALYAEADKKCVVDELDEDDCMEVE